MRIWIFKGKNNVTFRYVLIDFALVLLPPHIMFASIAQGMGRKSWVLLERKRILCREVFPLFEPRGLGRKSEMREEDSQV